MWEQIVSQRDIETQPRVATATLGTKWGKEIYPKGVALEGAIGVYSRSGG